MSVKDQVLCIMLIFFVVYPAYRGFISGIISHQLNKSSFRKRKKNQCFKEWFFFLRFKDVLPRIFQVFHFLLLIVHFIGIVACVILWIVFPQKHQKLGSDIVIIIMIFDFLWVLLTLILFWQNKPGFAFDRWIKQQKNKPKSGDGSMIDR